MRKTTSELTNTRASAVEWEPVGRLAPLCGWGWHEQKKATSTGERERKRGGRAAREREERMCVFCIERRWHMATLPHGAAARVFICRRGLLRERGRSRGTGTGATRVGQRRLDQQQPTSMPCREPLPHSAVSSRIAKPACELRATTETIELCPHLPCFATPKPQRHKRPSHRCQRFRGAAETEKNP